MLCCCIVVQNSLKKCKKCKKGLSKAKMLDFLKKCLLPPGKGHHLASARMPAAAPAQLYVQRLTAIRLLAAQIKSPWRLFSQLWAGLSLAACSNSHWIALTLWLRVVSQTWSCVHAFVCFLSGTFSPQWLAVSTKCAWVCWNCIYDTCIPNRSCFPHWFPHDDSLTVQRKCAGEKSCTLTLYKKVLFNNHCIVIFLLSLIGKMHINNNGSFLWTELLRWLRNRHSLILLPPSEITRSHLRWIIRWPFGWLLLTSPAAFADSLSVCLSVQHLPVVTTHWRFSLRTCPFLAFPFLKLV